MFGTVFHWLFGGLEGTDQNVEQLKSHLYILMTNQNVQQEQIKENFILNNLTRVEMTWNRRILKQLDVKLISLNHSVYSLQAEIGRLQIDRNFILSMLQIRSPLSTLLVGIIQLNKDLEEVYNYMTTLGSNVLYPSVISPVYLGKILIQVKQDLVGHPKLGLPSNYEGKEVWEYYPLLKIKCLFYRDALFLIVSVPVVDKSQTLTVYKIHNLSILITELCKHFWYNIPNDFIAITTNGLYITYQDLNEILSCQLSAGHYCEINTPFYCYVMQAALCVNCLGDKCLLHAKLMSTALTQLLIFSFPYLLTNKRVLHMYQ